MTAKAVKIMHENAIKNQMSSDRDVSESKQEVEELRDFFLLSLDMLCIAGTDGYFKRLNPAFEQTLGFTREELLAKPFLEFVHPEDRESTIAEVQRLSMGEPTVYFENRYLCKDGSYKWLAWTSFPREGVLYAVAHDITARRRAEEATRESSERIRLIVDTAHEAFIAIDANSVIRDWNKEAEVTFGWLAEEVIGQLLAETIIPQRYRDSHRKGLQHFLATGEGPVLNKRLELAAVHRDGHEFPIELTISAVQVGDSYIFNAFLHDITERKRMEDTLRKGHDELAIRVQEQTAELHNVNAVLQGQVAKLSESQQIAQIGSWERDVPTNTMTWSDELYRLYGLVPQSVSVDYVFFLERIHPDDREFVNETMQRSYTTPESFEFDYRLMLPDDAVR